MTFSAPTGYVAVRTWAPGVFVSGLRGPAASDDVTVPAQDGLRRDDQPQAPTMTFADDVEQERDERSVSPRDLRPRADLTLQHDELMS